MFQDTPANQLIQLLSKYLEGRLTLSNAEIAKLTGRTVHEVRQARKALTGSPRRQSQNKTHRRNEVRRLAAEGYNRDQLAAMLKVDVDTISKDLKQLAIPLPARVAQGTHKAKANRIMDQTAMDAEYLTADVDLVVFSELDPTRLQDWINTFEKAGFQLRKLVQRLYKQKGEYRDATNSTEARKPNHAGANGPDESSTSRRDPTSIQKSAS